MLNQNNAGNYYWRASLKYTDLKDATGVLIDYNQSIYLDQKYADAYYWRGTLKNCRLNDASCAIKDFRQSACLYMEEGKTDDFEKAIAQLKELGANAYSFPHKMKK